MSITPLPSEPLISVLMSNYNYGNFIGDAIDSVLGQSYPRLELIVCDDGSTDDSVDIVRSYVRRDRRVKLLTKENGGQASALNAAYLTSTGEILCLLDADDWFALGKLSAVLAAWEKSPDAGMVCHPMVRIGRNGAKVGLVPETGSLERGWIASAVHSRGGRWISPTSSAICLHRSLAEVVFPIPTESFRGGADWYVYTLAPLLSVIGSVDVPIGFYRIHGSNLSRKRHNWGLPTLTYSTIVENVRDRYSWIDEVNRRLIDLGHASRAISPSRDLYLAERLLMLEMVKPSTGRLALLRHWKGLTGRIALDDVTDRIRRLLMPLALGVAIALPRTARGRFLAALVGRSELRVGIRSRLHL